MSLKTFMAYQPLCDVEECRWRIEPGDYEAWFKSAEEAVEGWRDQEGWTDGEAWACPNHVFAPHEYIPDGGGHLGEWCARCRIDRDEHDPAAPAVLGNGEQA